MTQKPNKQFLPSPEQAKKIVYMGAFILLFTSIAENNIGLLKIVAIVFLILGIVCGGVKEILKSSNDKGSPYRSNEITADDNEKI